MTGPDTPRTDGDSGLLVPIPEAEAVIGGLRLRHDATATRGIPAHVTVLFPFVPRERIDDAVRSALREVVGGVVAFEYRFDRVERFANSTVYLAPEPAAGFASLIEAVSDRWPEHPPYGGVIETVVPHLTVGDGLADGEADAVVHLVGEALLRHGPITGRARAVWLMTEDAEGRWSTDSVLTLGEQRPSVRR